MVAVLAEVGRVVVVVVAAGEAAAMMVVVLKEAILVEAAVVAERPLAVLAAVMGMATLEEGLSVVAGRVVAEMVVAALVVVEREVAGEVVIWATEVGAMAQVER